MKPDLIADLIVKTLFFLLLFPLPSQGGQLGNGTTFFNKPPLLLDVTTTFKEVWVWSAKYYFTVNLPENAGETLQKLTIQQRQGQEIIEFSLNQTFAFEGTRTDQGKPLTISKVNLDPETNTITIIFNPSIPPGKTFTIALQPIRNPGFDGVYLFGVTAFPQGEKSMGLYLGVGRLQFYRGGNGLF